MGSNARPSASSTPHLPPVSIGQLVQICSKPEWFRVRRINPRHRRMELGLFEGTVPLASVTAVRND